MPSQFIARSIRSSMSHNVLLLLHLFYGPSPRILFTPRQFSSLRPLTVCYPPACVTFLEMRCAEDIGGHLRCTGDRFGTRRRKIVCMLCYAKTQTPQMLQMVQCYVLDCITGCQSLHSIFQYLNHIKSLSAKIKLCPSPQTLPSVANLKHPI